jgi:NADPH:quinone reductase-like Zn-dependent oxidoreductase
VLGRVEVVGLCFSDLKLLKQFSGHARKSPVVSGVDPQALAEMPNYVPEEKPTVPGHETVVRIVQVGPGVTRHRVGDRYLVQTDYRWLPTASSASAFGYNFEGALQEYVLMDERIVTAPNGESMLIPVPEEFWFQPWPCGAGHVSRTLCDTAPKLKTDGKMLGRRNQGIPQQPTTCSRATANLRHRVEDCR